MNAVTGAKRKRASIHISSSDRIGAQALCLKIWDYSPKSLGH
jgi:hypothetical protein